MIIDRTISRYVVHAEEGVRGALARMDGNEEGFVVCVDSGGVPCGVLTDGDFRRWAISCASPDLDRPVGEIVNRDFVCVSVDADGERIAGTLSGRITHVPLVDAGGRCVAVARHRPECLSLGAFRIGPDRPALLVAEIGNNHNGSLDLARRLVDEAVAAGADCVKFQMRDMETLYRNAGAADDVSEDLGTQYTLDLLSRHQLPPEGMRAVFDHARARGIMPLCTPWDRRSLDFLEAYGMPGYKVASADLTNHEFLRALARTGKPLLCSTGMSTEREIADAVDVLTRVGAQFVLLHCNSTYPAPFKDVNLRYMETLRRIGNCPVGYSGHERGYHVAVAAAALGACVVEKHFTLDRDMEGNDHRVSLLPGEFAEMVVAIRQVETALGDTGQRRITQGERMNRENLGKSLVINRDLPVGAVIEEEMIDIRSPGRGLPPYRKPDVVGRVTTRPLGRGDILHPGDIGEATATPRPYRFDRPFGIPVRYHDLTALAGRSNFDLLEFHLSYKDLDEPVERHLDRVRDLDLVVHAPELFAGDHVLDLCSLDEAYRRRSIDELGRVIGLSLRLRSWFARAERPRVVVNVGGFTADAPLPVRQRTERYALLLDSLSRLDLDGVELLPQTMPPFPWHFGGQRHQNLFVDPDEIAAFCEANAMRVCLDVSHSKLACTHFKWSFGDFVRRVGPHVAHLHMADSRGADGEGLQIDEGEVAFGPLGRLLREVAPNASFIPEIWQGHKDGGEGFWIALERLSRYLAPGEREMSR